MSFDRGAAGSERWFPLMDRPRWKRRLIVLVKATVALLVLWGVGRHVLRTWHDLRHHEMAIEPRPIYIVLSGLVYLAGLSCCAFFYEDILNERKSGVEEIRCQFIILAREEIRCQFIILARKDKRTPRKSGRKSGVSSSF